MKNKIPFLVIILIIGFLQLNAQVTQKSYGNDVSIGNPSSNTQSSVSNNNNTNGNDNADDQQELNTLISGYNTLLNTYNQLKSTDDGSNAENLQNLATQLQDLKKQIDDLQNSNNSNSGSGSNNGNGNSNSNITYATACGSGCYMVTAVLSKGAIGYDYTITNNTQGALDIKLYPLNNNGLWLDDNEEDNVAAGAVATPAPWYSNVTNKYVLYYRPAGATNIAFPSGQQVGNWAK